MRRLAALLAAWLLAGTAQAAAPCAMAEEPALPPARLALAKAAVAKAGRLVILGIGGAPMAGAVAQDPALTYLARLQAHLRVAMPSLQVEMGNHAGAAAGHPRLGAAAERGAGGDASPGWCCGRGARARRRWGWISANMPRRWRMASGWCRRRDPT